VIVATIEDLASAVDFASGPAGERRPPSALPGAPDLACPADRVVTGIDPTDRPSRVAAGIGRAGRTCSGRRRAFRPAFRPRMIAVAVVGGVRAT
jgi:hypothetical protein